LSGDDTSLAAALVDGLDRLTVHVWPERSGRPGHELLESGRRVAGDLSRRGLADGPLGVVLDTSWDSLAFLVGSVLAGAQLCSLPEAPRASSPDQHRRFLEQLARRLDLVAVVSSGRSPAVPGDLTFAELGHCVGPTTGTGDGFEFVQFTSGSTGDPKGVVLPQRALMANFEALIPSVLGPEFVAVSWLPLSHDMGLLGATLTPMVAAGGAWFGSGTLALIPPKAFVRRPGLWLDACSELGATLTAAPDFGYRAVTPLVARGHDLSRLRCAATGAEPVRPSTLRAFERAAAGVGLSPTAMRPCYGLAEAALAVTMTEPTHPWRSVRVDRDRLDGGEVIEVVDTDAASSGVELAGVGRPLPGFDVRIAGDEVGTVEVRGPSLLDRYTDHTVPMNADGWFTTMDLGFLVDGELHVVGRRDDVVVVAGRKLHAHDLEDAAGGAGTRPGSVMVVPASDGRPVVLFEPAGDAALSPAALAQLCAEIGERMLDASGAAPAAVLACPPGTLPRTPSGKPRRRMAEQWLRDGSLPTLAAG
jgi:fatty-acyl-CoA synthase